MPGLHAEKCCGETVLHERLPEVGDDLRRGVLESVEDPHEPGAHMVGAVHPRWRRVPGETEEVVPLVQRQPQPAGDRRHHLLRRLRATLLLQPRVVVRRHRAERRDLLTPQPRRTPPLPRTEPHVGRLQRLPPAPQEVGEPSAVHPPSLRLDRDPNQGPPVPG